MPSSCFVYGCTSGYPIKENEGKKWTFFSPPVKDEALFQKWERMCQRSDAPLTASSKICHEHFPEDMIIKRKVIPLTNGEIYSVNYARRRLTKDAFPCIFIRSIAEPELQFGNPKDRKLPSTPLSAEEIEFEIRNARNVRENEIENARNQPANAKNKIKNSKNAENAKNEMENSGNEPANPKNEIENSGNKSANAKNEMENSRNEPAKAKNEIKNARNEPANAENEMQNAKKVKLVASRSTQTDKKISCKATQTKRGGNINRLYRRWKCRCHSLNEAVLKKKLLCALTTPTNEGVYLEFKNLSEKEKKYAIALSKKSRAARPSSERGMSRALIEALSLSCKKKKTLGIPLVTWSEEEAVS